jgi:rRNA maturation RNase YbeY
MVKNLAVYTEDSSISKIKVHRLIQFLKKEFNLRIDFLSISFINSLTLKEINKKHLHHNYATDIITFNYSKDIKQIDGEILISYEDASRNAKKYGVSYGKEIYSLIVHGILHLLNYDDKQASRKKIMKKEENKLINKYYFSLLQGK